MCTCHTIIININIGYYVIMMSCTNLMLASCGFLVGNSGPLDYIPTAPHRFVKYGLP